MFEFIKKVFGFRKALHDAIQQYEEDQKMYVSMTNAEFAQLPEDVLFDAALARVESEVNRYEDMLTGIHALSHAKKVFYIAWYYEMEVNNGGLCQFFVNSSRCVAPELSAALQEIEAFEHQQAFDQFVADHHIDLNDLSSFDSDDASEFAQQYERYPFDIFDDAFYNMKPIQDDLTAYLKKHIELF